MAADDVTGPRSGSWTTIVVTGVLVLLLTLSDVTDSSKVLQPKEMRTKHQTSDPSSNRLSVTNAESDTPAHGKDESWRPCWLSLGAISPLKRLRRSSTLASKEAKIADMSSVLMIKPCMTWTLGQAHASQTSKDEKSSEPRDAAKAKSEKSVEKVAAAHSTCLEGPYLQAVVRKLDKAANLDYVRRAILERLKGSVPTSEPRDLPLPKTMWLRPAALAPCLNLTHTQLKVARLNAVRKDILRQIEGLSRLQQQGKAEGNGAKPKSKKKKSGKRDKRELWRRSRLRDVRGRNGRRRQQARRQRPEERQQQDQEYHLQPSNHSTTPTATTAADDPYTDHNTYTVVDTLDVHSRTNTSTVLDTLDVQEKISVMEIVHNMTTLDDNLHDHDTTPIMDLHPEHNITKAEDTIHGQNTTTIMSNSSDHNITARGDNLLSKTNYQSKVAKTEAGKELSPFLDKKSAVSFFPPRPAATGRRHWLRRLVEENGSEDESSSKDWDQAETSDDNSKNNDKDDRHSEVGRFEIAMKHEDPEKGLSEEEVSRIDVHENVGRDLDEEDIAVPGHDSSEDSEERDSEERDSREFARHSQIGSQRLWQRNKRVQRKDESDEKRYNVNSPDSDDNDDSESSDEDSDDDDEDDLRERTHRLVDLYKGSMRKRESLYGHKRQHWHRQGKDIGRRRRPPGQGPRGRRLSDPRRGGRKGWTAAAVWQQGYRARPERRGMNADRWRTRSTRPASNRRPDKKRDLTYNRTHQEFGLPFSWKGNRPSINTRRLATQAPKQTASPTTTPFAFTQYETTTTTTHDSSRRGQPSASSETATIPVGDAGNFLRPGFTSGSSPKNSSQDEDRTVGEALSKKAPAESRLPGGGAVPLETLPPGSTLYLGVVEGDRARGTRVDVMMPDPQEAQHSGSAPETPVYVRVQYKPARARQLRPRHSATLT